MRLVIGITVGALLLAGGLGVAGWQMKKNLNAPAVATTVRVEPVSQGELIETISAPGEVQPRVKVSISAKVAAPIVELPFKEGDRVYKENAASGKPASVLVRLDARDLEATLRSVIARQEAQKAQIMVSEQRIASSKATIESSRANLLDAERDLKRQIGLLSTADVSQSIVDAAQTKFDALKSQIESSQFLMKADEASLLVEKHQLAAAEADVARAKDDLSYTTIVSPIDGVVTRRKAEVGEMVVPGIQGSPGTTIMEVADLSQMLMVARIDEASVAQVAPGQAAKVRIASFGEEVFDGVVEWLANARAEANTNAGALASGDSTRYFECRIRLDMKRREVRSGLSADVDIEVHRHRGLKLPSQAVLGRSTESLPPGVRHDPAVDAGKSITTVVYRLQNGKAVCTPVVVGPSDETHTLIKSGLSAGEAVIVGPYKELEGLADGQVVKAE